MTNQATEPCKFPDTLPDLDELIALVTQTAALLTTDAHRVCEPTIKNDGSFVTSIDHGIQAQLRTHLTARWPHYGFIGEEMPHHEQVAVCENNHEQAQGGYWVIDPLDGTTNFTAGFLFYGISLALVTAGQSILAVVYDPVREECFSAQRGKGAYMNGQRLHCPSTHRLGNCIANIDYKRLVADLSFQLVRCPPYRAQRNLGASVLEWCWLATGRFHLYLHGGQKLWDFAAGYLILQESGGAATSLSKAPLDCGKLRKRSVVAAVNQPLLQQWIDWIDTHSTISQATPS